MSRKVFEGRETQQQAIDKAHDRQIGNMLIITVSQLRARRLGPAFYGIGPRNPYRPESLPYPRFPSGWEWLRMHRDGCRANFQPLELTISWEHHSTK